MVLAMITAHPPAQAANHLAPEHNLSIRFDLINHTVAGESHILLPADQELNLYVGGMNVQKVLLNGTELTLNPAEDRLLVPAHSSTQKIVIFFNDTWPTSSASFNAIDEKGISLTDIWHPVADREMIFKLTATVPEEFSAVSEAEEIVTLPATPNKGSKQVVFRFPHPLVALHFVAGPYVVEEETFGKDKILASYFFPEDQDRAAEYRKKARRFLERYEELIGPYPYARFAVVENRLPTGFAMPTFTLLGQAVLRLPFIKDTSLGHEILHQWFGNSVGVDRAQGNWAEGLTAYLADHAFAADEGRGAHYRKDQLIKYQSYVHSDNTLTLEQFTGADDDSVERQKIRAVGYSKGSMFFHMLQETLGDQIFLNALQDFYSRMKYQQAGWSDLQTSFENAANIGLQPIFAQWLSRPDIPALDISNLQVEAGGGRPIVSFNLLQKKTDPFQLTVPFMIQTSQGVINKRITVTAASTPVRIPLTGTPIELAIDPDFDLIRELTPEELPPTWSRFAGAVQKTAVVSEIDDPDGFAPFVELLQSMSCRIVAEKDIVDDDLSSGSLIFLGIESATSRSLFSKPSHPDTGVTVDIRNNPLNPAEVAVLISVANRDEAERVAGKLKHYGKYSYLHFINGRNQEKRITETDNGLRYELEIHPSGIPTTTARSFESIIEELLSSRAVYVGETHTSYQDHLLQLQIIRALHDHDPRLAIGMEMFSRPTQETLDDYIEHRIDERTFLKQSNYFEQWRFDYRLYRDIINFARRHRLPIIALNIDRKVVSSMYRNGSTDDMASSEEDVLPADRDLDMPGYRERLISVFQHHPTGRKTVEENDKFKGFLQAQALWDETMAESVADYLTANPDMRMVIVAGRGHTHKVTAIPPRVARRLPMQQAVVVNAEASENADPDAADYLFFSPTITLPPAPLLGVMLKETEDDSGALVADLSPQGQAREAGIKKGDIIIAIDNEPIKDVEDVKIAMAFKEGRESVRVRLKRPHLLLADEELELEVDLKSKKSPH
jgi:uncharacterized iron-regulated protein